MSTLLAWYTAVFTCRRGLGLADERRYDQKKLRVPGKGKGRFRLASGFDDALPSDVLDAFEGKAS